MTPTAKPKTDAERQALRRQLRKKEIRAMRDALMRIAHACPDAETREIAIRALIKNED